MTQHGQYGYFSIPNLPKPHYTFVKQACLDLELTRRQLVILALEVLQATGAQDMSTLRAHARTVEGSYPARDRRTKGPDVPGHSDPTPPEDHLGR